MISRVSAVTASAIFALIHAERAVGLHLEGARVEERVQLHGDAAPVRLVDAESNRSERRRKERGVHGPRDRGIDLFIVRELLQRP